MRILVTGATGYIGGRLVPRLLESGHDVRVLVRDRRRVGGRSWARDVDIREGDLLDRASIDGVADGIDAAAYLVHSMGSGAEFETIDREAASNFLAAIAPTTHVVYLGGLLPADAASTHLRSRAEVGEILRTHRSTLELRAGPIIGSGSASFEMVRYLTERLPAMVAPRWITNDVQPIGVDDVLDYLEAALLQPATGIADIGADRLTFREMMKIYAEVRGLRRWIIPVPVLAPRLAGLWVGLVTPIPNRLAVPLIEGIVQSPVVTNSRAGTLFPGIEPVPYREAVRSAIDESIEGHTETRWSGALGSAKAFELADRRGLIEEVRRIDVDAPPRDVFRAFSSLGGARGWPAWNSAWKIRGAVDRLVGGPGLRRGRRHPTELLPGEAVDFWRVEEVEPGEMVRLRAEMKVPGRAWLQWEVRQIESGSRLVQTAMFAPTGLAGTLYWYLLYPLHRIIFSDLARSIAKEAEAQSSTRASG